MPEKTANESLTDAILLIEEYDVLVEKLEKGELSDEEVDLLIGSSEGLGDIIDSLIALHKVNNERKKVAEKEMEKCKTMISRAIKRLQLSSWKGPNGSLSSQISWKFEYVDKETKEGVPLEYRDTNRNKINKALNEGKQVPGIIPDAGYVSITIR